MKHAKLIAGLFSLLVGLPLAATAQMTGSTSDLYMGFRATGGTGSTVNLVIDLGTIASFNTGGSLNDGSVHSIANFSSLDLASSSAGYGASWNTRSDVTWGIVGTSAGASKTLYASFAETTPGTIFSGSIETSNQSGRNGASALISGFLTNGVSGASNTVNSSNSASLDASGPASWTSYVSGDGTGSAFQFFDLSTFENTTTVSGGSYVVSDLYKYATNSTSVYLGSFALNSSGTLFFSSNASAFASPVPEPSTYAALAGVLALGAAAWRRRQQGKVAA